MPRRLNQLPPARKRRRLDETTTTSTLASRDTTPLSENEIFGLSNAMQKEYGWSHDQVVRPFQMAGIQAQLESIDMIIQAPTGAGKTVIVAGAHLSPRAKGTITLLSVPLVQLAEDMVATFHKEFKLSAIAIHSANGALSTVAVKDILAMKYQVVIASPEMLQSRSFVKRLLRNPKFSHRILSLVVDEAHCVSLWGAEFRKKYGTLGIVRSFLPRTTSVIAMTATLTARVRRDIHNKLRFAKHGSRFRNEGNDRPNVSIVVRACEHPLNSFADLDFLLPQIIQSPSDILKTYLYVDNITLGGQIIDHLAAVLEKRLTQAASFPAESVNRGLIRPFNASLSKDYRTAALEGFREGRIRILVCTDAAGMGLNIPDVDLVVQWKLPSTFSAFIQRAGRAARGHGRVGLAVLLVERSAYTVDLVSPKEPSEVIRHEQPRRRQDKAKSTSGATDQKSRAKAAEIRKYAIEHGLERGNSHSSDAVPTGQQPILDLDSTDEGLLVFVQSVLCRRIVWAAAFDDNGSQSVSRPDGVACCDICDPSLFNQTRPGVLVSDPKETALKSGTPDLDAAQKLMAWRKTTYQRDHAQSVLCPSAILPNTLILDLVSYGPPTSSTVRKLLEGRHWAWWDVYGEELVAFMETIPRKFVPMSKRQSTKPSESTGPDAAVKTLIECSQKINQTVDVNLSHAGWTVVANTHPMAVSPQAVIGFQHHTFDKNEQETVLADHL